MFILVLQITPATHGVGYLQNHLIFPSKSRNFSNTPVDETYDWTTKVALSDSKADVLQRIRKLFGILPAEQHVIVYIL